MRPTGTASLGILPWLGGLIVALSLFLACFGPMLAPFDPAAATDSVSEAPPGWQEWPSLLASALRGQLAQPVHWFGTDSFGFDVFSRTIAAPRTNLSIALAANVISLILGVSLGVVAGYFRHWSIDLLMRASDLLQSFPVFISAMILVALAGRSWSNIIIAMCLLYTPIYLRLTRGEVMAQRGSGFIECALAIGQSPWRIALSHVMPNALAPAIIQSSVTIGFAVLLTAGLSFVGAGVRPPTPEWGLMIANGAGQIVLGDWWPSVFPGIAISLTVFGFAALGHAVQRRYAA